MIVIVYRANSCPEKFTQSYKGNMKDLILSIFTILKYAGKILTGIRNTFFNLFFIAIIAAVVVALMADSDVEEPELKNNTALILAINGNIVEVQEEDDPFSAVVEQAMGVENPYSEILLQDILDAVNFAAEDDRISYLRLKMNRMGGAGLPQLEAIGHALTHFRKSGKKIIAAEDYYSQSQYYLASFADEIILNPMGGIDIHGFGVYRLYFKDVMDKLKINYHIFKVGTHKSALEPFMRNDMSSADREQNKEWLGALWATFSGKIAEQRGFSPDVITDYTNNAPENLSLVNGDTAKLALEKGLVDKLMTRIELRQYLSSMSAKEYDGSSRSIDIRDYLALGLRSYTESTSSKNVGLIVAQGMILPGEQPPGMIGSDTLAKTLANARKDNTIKAVVLRIDSGGGSAFASEIIRQELLELQNSGKKLIVSMGNTAASGGYWIAAPADQIWASPTTITGSIGIFGAIPTFEDSLAEMGIYSDGVGTTSISSGINLTQAISEDVSQSIQLSVEHGYNQFLSIVAEGRSMGLTEVEKLAEGRVYDGVRAKELGLVDELGNLDQAIDSAARLAGLGDDYSVVYVERPLSFKEKLIKRFNHRLSSFVQSDTRYNPFIDAAKKALLPVSEIMTFNDPKNIYAHSLLFGTPQL